MTKDQIIQLAKRIEETLQHQCNLVEVDELPAGLTDYMQVCIDGAVTMIMQDVETFANLIAAMEREACAKLVERSAPERVGEPNGYGHSAWADMMSIISRYHSMAAAIRARSNPIDILSNGTLSREKYVYTAFAQFPEGYAGDEETES